MSVNKPELEELSPELQRELSRLRWQCRRGMKELDQLMLRYLDLYYLGASDEERAAYKELMSYQEHALFLLLSGQTQSDDKKIAHVVEIIRQSPSVNYS